MKEGFRGEGSRGAEGLGRYGKKDAARLHHKAHAQLNS